MRKIVLKLIKFYQKNISFSLGMVFGSSFSCRFYPTCSEYSYKAIEQKGLFWGGWRSLGRILRCNPLSKGGIDPVRGYGNDRL